MRSVTPGLTAALLGLLALGACSTKRTLWIESCPPGATVWVDGENKGQAPVGIPFVHYGMFDVRLEMPGYEAVAEEVTVPTKIDGYPVVDLPFEFAVRQRHFVWRGNLTPVSPRTSEADLQRTLEEARAFRAKARLETGPDAVPPLHRPLPDPPPLNPGGFPGR